MSKNVLVVLGATNSPDGTLTDIAKSRLNFCAKLYTEGDLVLCTGGWGDHFNTSKSPHAEYSKAYLLKKGIDETHFLDFALSANTVDDAIKIKPIIEKIGVEHFTVITSDYHLERVKLIFNEILNTFNIEFIGVKSNFEKSVYSKLVAHEKKAIQAIKENGLYY